MSADLSVMLKSSRVGKSSRVWLTHGFCFVYSIFNQLRGNPVGSNGTEAVCVSGSAGQIVNYISCQPTGVREVDVIDMLAPEISSFLSRLFSKSEAAELVALP